MWRTRTALQLLAISAVVAVQACSHPPLSQRFEDVSQGCGEGGGGAIKGQLTGSAPDAYVTYVDADEKLVGRDRIDENRRFEVSIALAEPNGGSVTAMADDDGELLGYSATGDLIARMHWTKRQVLAGPRDCV